MFWENRTCVVNVHVTMSYDDVKIGCKFKKISLPCNTIFSEMCLFSCHDV